MMSQARFCHCGLSDLEFARMPIKDKFCRILKEQYKDITRDTNVI